nr:differentiation enhancing factor, DEF [mice, erythroleukemia cells, Peptide Partial, 15 aa] [Mus sp.]
FLINPNMLNAGYLLI